MKKIKLRKVIILATIFLILSLIFGIVGGVVFTLTNMAIKYLPICISLWIMAAICISLWVIFVIYLNEIKDD